MTTIPTTQHAIQITGVDAIEVNPAKPVDAVGPTQLLLQVEACGICFSDTKLLHAFDAHPRKSEIVSGLTPAELAEIPSYKPGSAATVPGHEPVGRVVAVGDAVKHFSVGDRVLVQADWKHLKTARSNGAFGYNFEGALQEYVVIDERCVVSPSGEKFLLSVSDEPSAAAVGLIEPWATVEAAYAARERQGLLEGGRLLVVADEGADVTSALVLAEAVAGDEASFVARMNQRAEALGMAGTHYVNPHGRDHDLQYTTAADLAVLARQVMKNETLRTICATQYKRIAKTNLTTDRYYFSNNALIISSTDRRKLEDYYYAPARGLMTGYSAAAGYNLVATAKKGGLELICVVLGASKDEASGNKRHYTDAVSLFTWCYGNLQYAELLKPLDPVCEVTVQLSNTRDAMTLVAPQGCWALIPADVAPAEMARSFELQQDIEAPIARGEVLGRVTFSHADIPYASCLLAAQSAAERSPLLFVIDRIGNFFSGRWARLVLFTTVVLVVLYLGLTILLNRRRRVQKARRRAGGKGPYR